jgi:L-cysteine desulfidase
VNTGQLLQLLHQDVVPALGCTEPVCVALAAADAAKAIGGNISDIEVTVSRSLFKNGMSVGIPRFPQVGLQYAAALGAYLARPDAGLEIMEGIDEAVTAQAMALVEAGAVVVKVAPAAKGIYVRSTVRTERGEGVSEIRDSHTNIVLTAVNGRVLSKKEKTTAASYNVLLTELKRLKLSEIRGFVENMSEGELEFLQAGIAMNLDLAAYGTRGQAGIGIAPVLQQVFGTGPASSSCNDSQGERRLPDGALIGQIAAAVAAAVEARLDGCPLATMSSAGSGSKGVAVIIPIVLMARHIQADSLHLLRALAFGHLVNDYINGHIGKLAAVCTCVMASSTAAAAAVTWLLGGDDEQIGWAVRNMTGSITGMICDGGKVGCALKLSTATVAAMVSAVLAVQGVALRPSDGICAVTPEQCVENMGRVSTQGMQGVDDEILRIMLEKRTT